uniref:Uncharacterized protein n=1 Tax=Piliocolobus tephrosceles TaxID=591936 RepID=A0A8C9IK19_9PRIM
MAAAEVVDTQLMLGVGLIQKGTNGEILLVWCYPSMTATLRNLLLRKCCLTDENKLLHHFVFGQYRRTWFYITTIEVPESSILKKVNIEVWSGKSGVSQPSELRASNRDLPTYLLTASQ